MAVCNGSRLASLGPRAKTWYTSPAEPVLCPHCSKPVSTLALNCVHCGQVTQRPPERARSVIQCPRCKVDAELISLGPVDVDHCAMCGNIWFDNFELERASFAADGALGADLRDAVRSLAPLRSPSQGPAVVECPFCSTRLIRRNHPTVPDVVAQVCFTHGAWLERPHLLRLVDDIETQGLEALKTQDKRREAQRAEHNRSVERQLDPLRKIARYHIWFWVL